MFKVVYYILYAFSLLPFFVLYGISDIGAFFLRVVFKYRRDVILNNLRLAFPEKTEQERKRIAAKFYQYFTDSFIEILKYLSISQKQLNKRADVDYSVVMKLLAEGKNVNIICGHQFNWEYPNLLFSNRIKSAPLITIYSHIHNKIFNQLMITVRSKYGALLERTDGFGSKMPTLLKGQYMLVLAADQNPPNPAKAIWVNFFGRPTAFLAGPEVTAKRNKVPVVYVGFKRTRRGYYQFKSTLLTDNGAHNNKGEITKAYVQALTLAIQNDPPNYLWSHKRFKHDWRPEYGPVYQ